MNEQLIESLEKLISDYMGDERLFLEQEEGIELDPDDTLENCESLLRFLKEEGLDSYSYYTWLQVKEDILFYKSSRKYQIDQLLNEWGES